MKASEFRYGNWVKYDNKYFQIHLISESMPCLNTSEFGIGVVSWKELQPIILTAEILKKCGFEKGLHNWFTKSYFTDCNECAELMNITINAISFRCGVGDSDFGGTIAMTGKIVKYLHQLQNLIWTLSGEELVVNL